MKQLILLRHGEAGPSTGSDFKRTLTPVGRKRLHNLGSILKNKGLEIDRMFCSSATRTVETAEIINDYIPIKDSYYKNEMYSASMEGLLEILEKTPDEVKYCLLVGHNPTISLLSAYLTSGDYIGLQPGMMAILELGIENWSMLGMNTASLREVMS